jgi:hypothetical protein
MHASENVIKVLVGNKSDCADREVNIVLFRWVMNKVNKLLTIMESRFSKQVQNKIATLNKHSIIWLNK